MASWVSAVKRENMRVYVCWTLRLAPETGMDLLDR